MNVFISHSSLDKEYAHYIEAYLSQAGHEVWLDSSAFKPGDNLIEKLDVGLREADAVIVIVSRHSLQSKWIKHEFSALALRNISGETARIIPVLIDTSTVPEYLAQYIYVDLTVDRELGLERIIQSLRLKQNPKISRSKAKKRDYGNALNALSNELNAGRLTLVCGAGASIGAGIPSWNSLLLDLLKLMMVSISKNHSISLQESHAEQFQNRYSHSALVIGKYLKSNLGKDFLPKIRDILYESNPTKCDVIDSIVELARPQRDGKPLDSIITFNFDALIEENLEAQRIRHKAITVEGERTGSGELPIFHVHGYLPRKGRIQKGAEIVFSEDAYHNQFIDPFSWSNLIQLNKLSQNTCLFVGLSLADPNLRRLLDVSNRKNPSRALSHYIIKKAPSIPGLSDEIDDLAYLLEEQDANELGLNVIWINDFSEVSDILNGIGRKDV
ncbi:MAG: hypothetical protein ACJATK_001133 [Paracoccaceae bacterium]